MSRNATIVTNFKLINWYGFTNTLILPLGMLSNIAAENKAGKTAMLDAIRYGLQGDSNFNPASETGKNRTLEGYVRGLVNPENATYMRPVDTHPDVYCHIAIQFNNEVEGDFVIDTLIHAGSKNTETYRYIILNKTIADIEQVLLSEDGIPANKREMDKRFGKPVDIEDVFAAQYLRYSREQIRDFNSKQRKLIAYKPTANVSDFIKSNVLEKKKADLDGLFERKDKVSAIEETYSQLIDETNRIQNLRELREKIDSTENKLLSNDMLERYISAEHNKRNVQKYKDTIEAQTIIASTRKADRDRFEEEDDRLREKILTAKDAQNKNDSNLAIKKVDDELDCIRKNIDAAKTKIQQIQDYQDSVKSLMTIHKSCDGFENQNMLLNLMDGRIPVDEKNAAVSSFSKFTTAIAEKLHTENAVLEKEKAEYEAEKRELDREIQDYERNRVNYSRIAGAKNLCEMINSEIKKAGRNGEARLAFEYVSSISDEKWRNSLELFLGKGLFVVIVDESCYDIAYNVFKQHKHTDASIFNTRLLMKKPIEVKEDSAAKFLNITDPVARKYFDYKLGRMHAVPTDDVPKYENAISPEGIVSSGMETRRLDFGKIKTYYLGQDSIEKNKMRCAEQRHMLGGKIKALSEKLKASSAEHDAIAEWKSAYSGILDFKALTDINKLEIQKDSLEDQRTELLEAKKNDLEFMSLQNVIEESERRRKELRNLIDAAKKDIEDAESERRNAEFRRDNSENKLKEDNDKLFEMESSASDVFYRMVKTYNERISNGENPQKDKLADDTVKKYRKSIEHLQKSIYEAMMEYSTIHNNVKVQPVVDYETAFKNLEGRFRVISTEKNPEVKEKMKKLKEEYENEFKNGFVLKILQNCKQGKEDIHKLNRRLRTLTFNNITYEFRASEADDSDYGIILEYARYLEEQNSLHGNDFDHNEAMFGSRQHFTAERGQELEKEMGAIIGDLLNSKDESRIEELSDYRNYMSYKLIYHDPEKGDLDYEKSIAKLGSGAEVQIPHTLVLISSLLSMYSNPQSLRIMFMDEPFVKMSASNIRVMTEFIKKQNLQCVFCTPDKMESIGESCDVIIGLQKDFNDKNVSVAFVHRNLSEM